VRRLLFLVCCVVFVETMLYSALVPLLPGYAHEFGLSKSAAGLLVGAYAAGAVLGALPGGIAAARYGPRRALLIGLAIMGVSSLAFGFAGDAWTLGLARLAQGLGGSLAWAGALTWLIAGTPRERRGEMLGTAIGSAIFGALLGPVVGALAHHVGPRPVFVGLAGLSVVLGAWALRLPPADAEPPRRGALKRAIREPQVLGALWLMTIPALVFGVVGVLAPLALDDAGWSAAAIAIAWVASAAIEMVIAPLIGRISDRRGRLLPLRISLAGAVAVLVAFALADRPAAIVPVLILSGVTFGAFWAPAMALLSDAAERIGIAQGLAFGLMNAAWGAGNALGPPIGGALADAGGDALPYSLAAVICAGTLIFLLVGTRDLRVPESS
jgi:predicted MFS family arabinose efflux permease